MRTQFRKIFTQMGFEEMPTNNYVESSFWNFDALFQPQQHPARDAHDTFFLTSARLLLAWACCCCCWWRGRCATSSSAEVGGAGLVLYPGSPL